MSILSRLFGSGPKAADAEPVVHNDFRIFPEPARQGSHYRVGARIEKDIAGEVKTHVLIRADTFESETAAAEASIAKARMLIDQQGDTIFD